MNVARRRFIQRTLGVVSYIAVAVAGIVVVPISGIYAYRAVAAYTADAAAEADEHADREARRTSSDPTVRAMSEFPRLLAPIITDERRALNAILPFFRITVAFSLGLLAVAGVCLWARRFLALGDEEGSA